MSSGDKALGGAEPIKDINEVQFIGREAVKIHNDERRDNLVFIRVVNGLKQIVDQTLYSLVIEARNGDGTSWIYVAKMKVMFKLVTHDDPSPHRYVLISWEDPLKYYD